MTVRRVSEGHSVLPLPLYFFLNTLTLIFDTTGRRQVETTGAVLGRQNTSEQRPAQYNRR